MKKPRTSTARHYLNHLTCTLFVILGLLGILAPASQAATGAFTFSAATDAVGEGAGKVNITINRVGGSTGSASVSFRTNQISAIAGSDFVGSPLTKINFAHRERHKVVSVNIINDTAVESDETFEVLLSNPTYGTSIGNISSSVITIQDNDIAAVDTIAPTVTLTSPANGFSFTSAQAVTISASAVDNIGVSKVELYDGTTLIATELASPYSFAWAITSANNGSHSFTAKAYDATGNITTSAAKSINVNISVVVPVYEAPVLNSVTISNGNYLLAWSIPNTGYGVPAGGYDIFTDGADDNLHHTTLSAVKSGLPLDIEHCFVVEARWSQAVPSVFPASNIVCVQGTQSADVTAPSVSLTSPATGTTLTSAQTVTISASAADNVGVNKVELYDGTTLKGTDTTAPYSFAWAITSANNGSHSFTAKAYDAAGNSKVSTAVGVTVNIPVPDVTAPTVSLTSPVNGTTLTSDQTLTIAASAADNVGVSKVELYDGTTLKGTDTTAPYSFAWAITSANNGSHSLTAKAYDAAGNVATSTEKGITVNIATAVTPAVYSAPVLKSATISNGDYLLTWTLPTTSYGTPEGGYDVFTDGADDNLHHTTLSAVKSGLPLNIEHCFVVEARWTQTSPSAFPASNKVCVQGTQITDITVPSVSLTSPVNNTTFTSAQTVTVAASAADNVGVSKVELYDGATLKGTDTTSPYSFAWAITSANNGSHSLTTKAYDAAGNSKISVASTMTVNISASVADLTAPTVSLTSPATATTFTSAQTVTVAASAADNIGVSKVELYDGTTLKGTDTTSPYSFAWAITSANNGNHSLTAKAYDAAGNSKISNAAAMTVNIVTAPITGAVKVFPGAEGFGTQSVAGRKGKIIHVTNLNDSGTGTLREAVQTSGPRTIVFDVGGVIYLSSMLRISQPYCTIAGQTAPGQGILLRDYGVTISTNDVLIQHIAIRPGDEGAGPYDTLDGLQILSPSNNVVIDHCSVSWAIDENADTWTDVRDVTFSNCIISEGLLNSLHSDGKHSKGYLAGRRNQNIAFIKNLQAHNDTRNPMVYGKTSILLVNNVFYNAGGYSFSSIGDGWFDGAPKATIVGNVYKKGPGTTAPYAIKIESSAPAGTEVYEASNYFSGGTIRGGLSGYYVTTPPVSLSGITIKTNENEILSSVLTNAGARPAYRDAVDNRIANPSTGEVVTGKGSWVDSVNAGGVRAPGGWPTYPLTYRTFDEGSNPLGDDDGNSYTNVEEILYQMALQVENK